MWRIKLGLIVVGGILIFISAKELILASKTSDTPSIKTCSELIQNGPGNNHYINLTNYVPCMNWFVYETYSQNKNPKGSYEVVYLPAVEFDGPWHRKAIELYQLFGDKAEFPAPQNVKVLLKIKNVRDNRHLDEILSSETLNGMVINSIESIGSKEKALLKQGYPNLDVDSCYIFEVNRTPASIDTQVSLMVTGIILIMAGLFIILILPRMEKRKAAKAVAAAADVEPTASDQPEQEESSLHDSISVEDDHKNPYA